MKINHLNKVSNAGKVKAFFSIEWPGKLIIRDCKLIENDKGELWAAMPSRQYEHQGQKKWVGIVQILDENLLNKITMAARQVYGGDALPEDDVPF